MRKAFYLNLVSENILFYSLNIAFAWKFMMLSITSEIPLCSELSWSIFLLIVLNSDRSAVILCLSFVEDVILASSNTLI